jgi:hypothetical protein
MKYRKVKNNSISLPTYIPEIRGLLPGIVLPRKLIMTINPKRVYVEFVYRENK